MDDTDKFYGEYFTQDMVDLEYRSLRTDSQGTGVRQGHMKCNRILQHQEIRHLGQYHFIMTKSS